VGTAKIKHENQTTSIELVDRSIFVFETKSNFSLKDKGQQEGLPTYFSPSNNSDQFQSRSKPILIDSQGL